MALETITVKDAAGTSRNVVVDDDGGGNFTQVQKTGFGADGAVTTLVSTGAPMPTRRTAGTIGDNRKTVTTAGTRETLASSTACFEVTITAETDNTGIVVIGGTTCVAALATRRGTPLAAGESMTLIIDDLNKVNLDVTVNGDGVTYTYLAA